MFEYNTVYLAIARDTADRNIVFAGVSIFHTEEAHKARENGTFLQGEFKVWLEPRLFLSTDGERSWREVNVFPHNAFPYPDQPTIPSVFAEVVRVAKMGESIVLYATDGTTWWQATLPPNSLPLRPSKTGFSDEAGLDSML